MSVIIDIIIVEMRDAFITASPLSFHSFDDITALTMRQ